MSDTPTEESVAVPYPDLDDEMAPLREAGDRYLSDASGTAPTTEMLGALQRAVPDSVAVFFYRAIFDDYAERYIPSVVREGREALAMDYLAHGVERGFWRQQEDTISLA